MYVCKSSFKQNICLCNPKTPVNFINLIIKRKRAGPYALALSIYDVYVLSIYLPIDMIYSYSNNTAQMTYYYYYLHIFQVAPYVICICAWYGMLSKTSNIIIYHVSTQLCAYTNIVYIEV